MLREKKICVGFCSVFVLLTSQKRIFRFQEKGKEGKPGKFVTERKPKCLVNNNIVIKTVLFLAPKEQPYS